MRGQKGDVFEGGHRVPAIARWPGRIKSGSVTQETTMTMDLMPTYLELAKAKATGPHNKYALDGKTLAPILFEGLPMSERALFWRRGKDWAVRRGPWKLVGSTKSEMKLFNLDDDIYGNIMVAVTESVNNAIRHGNKSDKKKNVHLTLSLNDNLIRFIVKDEGIGFDYHNLPDPTSPENIDKPSGRGIFLMRHLSDEVTFKNEGSEVELCFYIN